MSHYAPLCGAGVNGVSTNWRIPIAKFFAIYKRRGGNGI
jgi:stringent starvation protein B